MSINLGTFLQDFGNEIATYGAEHLLGTDKGDKFLKSIGVNPAHLTQDQIKQIAQQAVNAGLATAKPQLETTIDGLITKYVPSEVQPLATTEINTLINNWTITV